MVSKRYIHNFIANGLIGLAIFCAVEFVYMRTAPMKNWVHYYAVEPARDVLNIDDPLFFVSTSEVKKVRLLKWRDVLRCKVNGNYVFYSVYESSTVPKKRPKTESKWQYNAKTPVSPTTCYLDTNVTVHLNYGIERTQHITSKEFTYEMGSN